MNAVVENVAIKREPLPKLSGVYFMTPSNESVGRLIEDFQAQPLYKTAHVFFSSPASNTVLAAIRSCPGLTSRLKNLKEVLLSISCMVRLFSDAQYLVLVLLKEDLDDQSIQEQV